MAVMVEKVERRYSGKHPLWLLASLRKSFKWAWLDTVCRYRRSRIGPLWETINVLVSILGVTLVSSSVLGSGSLVQAMPYVGLGIISWSAIATVITEGTTVFTKHASHIRGTSMGIDLYVGRTVFGSLITFCHHLILYAFGVLLLPIDVHWTNLLAIPGIVLFYANAMWIVPFLGLLCARFRDIEQIIRNLVQLAFFVTPVFWKYDAISADRKFIVDYNPLFYFLEIIRDPLLGQVPTVRAYLVVVVGTAAGYLLLYVAYRSLRARLALFV
jgi:ABC-type polysaccharide/polyol phosphate export permease